MNFRLCLVALLNADILPRITVHEYRLATSSSNSTQMATGPILLIISASALKPCVPGVTPWLVPLLSACKMNANTAVEIAIHLMFHGIRPRSPRPSDPLGAPQQPSSLFPLPSYPAIHAMLRSDSYARRVAR